MNGRKLVILGGSSRQTPAFFEAVGHAGTSSWDDVCLVGRSAENVERVGQLCRMLVQAAGLAIRVSWDIDLARAATGASVVLNMLRVGGEAAVLDDRRLLAASGVVGHAASYPEAIRHLGPTLTAAHKVQAVAPNAVFINFANPVSILCEAIAEETALKCIGICHHAFSMQADFARLLNVPSDRVRVEYLGLNHLGWVTDVVVGGISRLTDLIEQLVRRRVKAYDYQLAPLLSVVPIKHAAALYHKGEVLYVRQSGTRGSLFDVMLRYGAGGGSLTRLLARRAGAQPAPWYASCIVPFLDALMDGHAREFIVTWRHAGRVPQVPGMTAETTARLEAGQVEPARIESRLPDVAQEWLRQVRESERLLVSAVKQRSPATLVESLAIHPSVASVRHAQRLVERLEKGSLFADV